MVVLLIYVGGAVVLFVSMALLIPTWQQYVGSQLLANLV